MYYFIWSATHQHKVKNGGKKKSISKASETNLCSSKDSISCFAEGWQAWAMNIANGSSSLGTAHPEGLTSCKKWQ